MMVMALNDERSEEINDRTDDKVNKSKQKYCGKMDKCKEHKNKDDMRCAARAH